MHSKPSATLYRMVMDEHVCPYGIQSKWLLERAGYRVDDRRLTSREETDAFKSAHGVETTPQIFIDGQRIGGHDALRRHLGKPVADPDATSYRPVLALFGMMALMAIAAAWVANGRLPSLLALEWFLSFSVCALAYLKLRDVERFSTMFLNYDLVARRWVPYAYLYPFAEALVGVLMTAHTGVWLAAPVALLIGSIGAVSVFKAVYVDHRELKCACVGGDSTVPLGFVSLSENLAMIAMALWMPLKPWLLSPPA